MQQYELTVEGMDCTGCEERVTNVANRIDGVLRVQADHETGSVEITGEDGIETAVREAIHAAGFDIPA